VASFDDPAQMIFYEALQEVLTKLHIPKAEPAVALANYERLFVCSAWKIDREFRSFQASVYNHIGTVALDRRRPGTATRAFERSMELATCTEKFMAAHYGMLAGLEASGKGTLADSLHMFLLNQLSNALDSS
jgi:hypothetical protein